MNVRSQISMVFLLDECIGCHTCSLACKNIWTDRKGSEYMWWNNVETKPGCGSPTQWENQEKYGGGRGGTPIYAKNDPNLEGLTEEQREQLSSIERLVFFYFPRICNHCLNPACVAAGPPRAPYKRGGDGIRLL